MGKGTTIAVVVVGLIIAGVLFYMGSGVGNEPTITGKSIYEPKEIPQEQTDLVEEYFRIYEEWIRAIQQCFNNECPVDSEGNLDDKCLADCDNEHSEEFEGAFEELTQKYGEKKANQIYSAYIEDDERTRVIGQMTECIGYCEEEMDNNRDCLNNCID